MFRNLPTPVVVLSGLPMAVVAPVMTLVLPVVTLVFGVVATGGKAKTQTSLSKRNAKHTELIN